jgi:hypothetical protein
MLARIRVECGALSKGAQAVWGFDLELCLKVHEPIRPGPFLDGKAVERARREGKEAGWPEVCGVPACRASGGCRGKLARFRDESSAPPCRIIDLRLLQVPWTLSPQEIGAVEIVRPVLARLLAKDYRWFGLRDGSWPCYMPRRTAEWTALVMAGLLPYPDDPTAMPLRAPPDAAWKAIGLKKRPFRRGPDGQRPTDYGEPEPLVPDPPKPKKKAEKKPGKEYDPRW